MNIIEELLNAVTCIKEKYDKIAELSGQNFNIFRILKVQKEEVRLHSSFIAELLNPKGCHDQKDEFLILFLELLKEKFENLKNDFVILENDFENFKEKLVINTKNAKAEKEKYIGPISEKEGGIIDILISETKNIIIENKIYAGDQKNQLLRYHNYDDKAILLYLTLDGKEPDPISTNSEIEQNKHYFRISYKKDILKWLEKCKEKSVNQPLLRETLTQYINTIKKITGIQMENDYTTELISLLNENKNFAAALKKTNDILENKKTKRKVIETILLKNIKNNLDLELKNQENSYSILIRDNDNFKEKDTYGILIKKSNWKSFDTEESISICCHLAYKDKEEEKNKMYMSIIFPEEQRKKFNYEKLIEELFEKNSNNKGEIYKDNNSFFLKRISKYNFRTIKTSNFFLEAFSTEICKDILEFLRKYEPIIEEFKNFKNPNN